MVTLTWVPPPGDGIPTNPNEAMSGFKEFRVLRSDVGKRYYTLALNGILPAGSSLYQESSYNDGDFVVIGLDNAGNVSLMSHVVAPIVDRTPPPPVSNIAITVSNTAPPTTHARMNTPIPDATGANYTLIDADPAFSTTIEWLSDHHNDVWQTLTTLAPGVTSGRLTYTWVQGTNSFLCMRATQDGVTTPQSCNTLASVFPGTPVVLQSVSISPATINGGGNATGTVTLSQSAPSGGAVVSLVSNTPGVLQVPATVTVVQGTSSQTFSVTTTNPSVNTSVIVTATYGASTVQFTAGVIRTVIGPGPNPDFTNEPAGFTTFVDHDFSTVVGGGLVHAMGGGVLVTDQSDAIVSPPTALKETRPASGEGGGLWAGYYNLWHTEVFAGISHKYAANYEGPPEGTGKLYLFWCGTGNIWVEAFVVGLDPTGYVGCILAFPDADNSHIEGAHPGTYFGGGPGTQAIYANVGNGTVFRDQWFKIETYYRLSSSLTSKDGIVKVWLNDNLIMDYSNVNFSNGPNVERFYAFDYTSTWSQGWGPSQDSDKYVDHLYMSAKV